MKIYKNEKGGIVIDGEHIKMNKPLIIDIYLPPHSEIHNFTIPKEVTEANQYFIEVSPNNQQSKLVNVVTEEDSKEEITIDDVFREEKYTPIKEDAEKIISIKRK